MRLVPPTHDTVSLRTRSATAARRWADLREETDEKKTPWLQNGRELRSRARVVSAEGSFLLDDRLETLSDSASSVSSVSSTTSATTSKPTTIGTTDLCAAETQRPPRHHPEQNENYLIKRDMSLIQERWNAITVIPNVFFCLWYLRNYYITTSTLPPLTMTSIALGIVLHAPFSFLYHWQYAPRLERHARIQHWSRRMDQVFIHVASTLICYGTSKNVLWSALNFLYNGDSIARQMQPKVLPLRNQLRIGISMILYTLPILQLEGGGWLFVRVWTTLMVASWLFATYPFKGWSHCVFHIVACALPPLLFEAASKIEDEQ